MKVLINIDVPELNAAVDFYRAALGLRLGRLLDGDVAELVGASCLLYLLQKEPGSAPNARPGVTRDYARHWTPVHMDFVVEHLEEAVERALAAGARQESNCVEWRDSRCISFADPFGHGFCLIEFAGDGYTDS